MVGSSRFRRRAQSPCQIRQKPCCAPSLTPGHLPAHRLRHQRRRSPRESAGHCLSRCDDIEVSAASSPMVPVGQSPSPMCPRFISHLCYLQSVRPRFARRDAAINDRARRSRMYAGVSQDQAGPIGRAAPAARPAAALLRRACAFGPVGQAGPVSAIAGRRLRSPPQVAEGSTMPIPRVAPRGLAFGQQHCGRAVRRRSGCPRHTTIGPRSD